MARPKGKTDTRQTPRKRPVAWLLRILILLVGLGLFTFWRPLGEIVPSASTITASAMTVASDAVNAASEAVNVASGVVSNSTWSFGSLLSSGDDAGDGSSTNTFFDARGANGHGTTDQRWSAAHEEVGEDDEQSGSHGGAMSQTLTGSIHDDEEKQRQEDEEHRLQEASKKAAAEAAAATLPKVTGPFFTCPDGRIGMHIVHIPLLLDQSMQKGASGIFMAGRMLMFRDFALPSLARQTAQGFIVYVSHDPDQNSAFVKAGRDALKAQLKNGASFLYMPDNPLYFRNKPDRMLAYPRIANLIAEHNIADRKTVRAVTLYITSKMDSDDAVHMDAVRMIQEEACNQVGPEESDRLLAAHLAPKLAWFPHANTTYGVLAVPNNKAEPEEREAVEHQMAAKPHLQSIAIDASLLLCQAPLNCYSAGEGDPSTMLGLATADDCPFTFHADKNSIELYPDGAIAGALYSRPPLVGNAAAVPPGVNFTIEALELGGFSAVPFKLEAITDCGIAPGELSATNLLLASIYAEAPYMAGLSATDARGWGRAGGLVKAPAPPTAAEGSSSSSNSDNGSSSKKSHDEVAQGDGMDEEVPLDAGRLHDDEDGGGSHHDDYDASQK